MTSIVFEGHFYFREYQITHLPERDDKLQLHKYKEQVLSKYLFKSTCARSPPRSPLLCLSLPCGPPLCMYLQETRHIESVFLLCLEIISFYQPAQLFPYPKTQGSIFVYRSSHCYRIQMVVSLRRLTVSCSFSMLFRLLNITHNH